MNLEPPCNVDNRPTLSDRLKDGMDLFFCFEALTFVLPLIIGLGSFGYVIASWIRYFLLQGNYLIAAVVVGVSVIVAGAACLRIPIALVIVLGGAMIIGTAFLGDSASLLLP